MPSFSGNRLAGTERTNMSDDLRALCIGGMIDRHKNSFYEFAIKVLCLEDAALRTGVIPRRETPLEKLDLEGMARSTVAKVDFRIWTTNSLNSSNGENNPKLEKEKERGMEKIDSTSNQEEDALREAMGDDDRLKR